MYDSMVGRKRVYTHKYVTNIPTMTISFYKTTPGLLDTNCIRQLPECLPGTVPCVCTIFMQVK